MNEAAFAQVAVENTVYHFDKLFTYRVPLSLREQLKPGVRVSVPFGSGNRKRVGLVFSLSSQGEGEKTKDVEAVLDREPALSPSMLDLVRWMKERYYCTFFEAAKQMIPTGYHLRLQNSYVLREGFKNFDREDYTDGQWLLLQTLQAAGKAVPGEKLSQETGLEENSPALLSLLEQGGCLQSEHSLEPDRGRHRENGAAHPGICRQADAPAAGCVPNPVGCGRSFRKGALLFYRSVPFCGACFVGQGGGGGLFL